MSEPQVSPPVIDLERYFVWLCARIRKAPPPLYDDLLKLLFEYDFVWLTPGDDNREADGLAERRKFELSTGWTLDPSWRTKPCSMLEMMVALSERANFLTDMPMADWFWIILDNLELSELRQMQDGDVRYVEEVLYNLNYRLYRENGLGGMFPLTWPRQDQAGIEIWYQLAAYIDEQHLV